MSATGGLRGVVWAMIATILIGGFFIALPSLANAAPIQGVATNLQGASVRGAQQRLINAAAPVFVDGINLQGSLYNSKGSVKIADALIVKGGKKATFTGEVVAKNGLTVEAGTISLPENSITDAAVVDALTITGGTISESEVGATTLTVADDATFDGDVTVAGGLALDDDAIGDAEVVNALTVSSGTINNTVIGGTTAAAGSFTTVSASGDGVFDSDVLVGDSAETISDSDFNVNGGEIFVAGDAGVEGTIYADGSAQVAGNISVGDGTPSTALDGEDVYIEGGLEVDGALNVAGAVADMNLSGSTSTSLTLDSDSSSTAADQDVALNFADDGSTTAHSLTYDDGLGLFLLSDGLTVSTGGLILDAGDGRIDEDLVVGGSTSTTETLSNASFTMGGDDLFVAGTVGVEGNVFSDGSFVAGNSGTTYADGGITDGAGDYTLTLAAATDDFVVSTGNLKVGNGTPGTTQNGEDFYVEGTSEFDGNAVFDGNLTVNGTFSGAITDAGTLDAVDSTSFLRSDASDAFTSGTLTINSGTTLDVAGGLTLSASGGTITANSGMTVSHDTGTDLTTITTGNLEIGNATETSTLNGEDVMIEGNLEADGVMYADGGLDRASSAQLNIGATNASSIVLGAATTTNSNLTVSGGLTGNGNNTFNGTVTSNSTSAFNSDVDMSFLTTENFAMTNAGQGDVAFDLASFSLTNTESTTSNAQNVMVLTNAATSSTTVTESLLKLVNAENTASVVTDGILIDSTSSTDADIVDAIDVSDSNITNALNIGANTITGTTGVIDLTDFDVDADGNVTQAPDAAGDAQTMTLAAGASQGLVVNASAAMTETAGIVDLDVNAGNAAVDGINVALTQNDGATAAVDATAAEILLTGNDADGDMFGLTITGAATTNAAAGSYEAGIVIDNAEETVASMTDGLLIKATTDTATTDGVDVSDAELV
ncbi:MAG: hypothetical protein HYV32_02450, partial [Candidatus Kerfeldbacteria bacterium]|nr:hypothetical protein [Candidatus Kerfeldbacteria bacterium]